MPESFNVMMKELQSLCLDVELVEDKEVGEVLETPVSSEPDQTAAAV